METLQDITQDSLSKPAPCLCCGNPGEMKAGEPQDPGIRRTEFEPRGPIASENFSESVSQPANGGDRALSPAGCVRNTIRGGQEKRLAHSRC